MQASLGRIAPFAVERWFARYEFKVTYNLAESCVLPLRVEELLALAGGGDGAAATATALNTRLGYIESDGLPALREAVAGLYPTARPDPEREVLLTVGAIEANLLGLSALAEPGARLVVAVPTYQQLYEVPRAMGARVDFWPLQPELGWLPDLDHLRQLLQEPARAVVVNFPNNPTGVMPPAAWLAEFVGICRERDVLIYADEVYRGLTLTEGEEPPPSLRELAPERVVAVGSLSKAYGLPGLRTGWLVAPRALRQRAAEIRDYTSICGPALSEHLALLALAGRRQLWDRGRRHARQNLALVQAFLADHPDLFSWRRPDQGVVGFVRLHLPLSAAEFAERLAEEQSTLILPGTTFEREGYFRLGFGYETAKLQAGLERLGALARSLAARG